MNKCYILTRQSSFNGDDSLSIEQQIEACKKLAEHEKLEIVKIFKEPGFSGRLYPTGYEEVSKADFIFQEFVKNTPKENQFRPGLGEILTKLNEVQYIVVYDVTRLMRPLNGSFLQNVIVQKLIKHKIKVWCVKEGVIDYANFQDSLYSSITSQINSEQLLIQRQKSIDAKNKVRDKGEFSNGMYHILGYEYVNKNLGFVEDKIGADIVRFVADAYVEKHMRPIDIAREIAEKFPEFRKRNDLTHPSHLIKQICNPLYAGYSFNTDNILIPFKPTKGKELYSLETYFKFKEKLDNRKRSNTRATKGFYPLTSKMQCCCGAKMYSLGSTFWKGVRLNKYVCSSYKSLTGAKGCHSNIQITYDTEEGLSLHSCIKPLLVAEVLNRMEIALKNSDSDLDLKNAEIKLSDLRSKEKKLTNLYLSDMLSEELYTDKIKQLKEEIKKFEQIKKSLLAPRHKVGLDKQIQTLIDIQNGNISDDDFADLCANFIKKIISHPDRLEVVTAMGITVIPKNLTSRGARMFNFVLGLQYDVLKNGMDWSKAELELVWYAGKKREITIEEFEKNAKLVQKLGRLSIYVISK